MNYKIGISCVGGGVGQSVISSCRLSQLPIYTVGLDTNPFAYGAYDCDAFEYLPSVYSEDYISRLIDICKSHGIELIIPGLDDEILMYARNKERFASEGIKTIVSGKELIKLCRDKEQMSVVLNRVSDVFVSSYSKETVTEDIANGRVSFPLIAKPRGGSASKGINIILNQEDLNSIGDQHIIQELAVPAPDDPNYPHYNRQIKKNINPQVAEISIQIVTDKHGNLLGKMASYNKLKDGIPIEIVPVDDQRIWKVVDGLIPHFLELGLRGPLNIQGRLTEMGLKIFEMNPRFTGITGLRALMGFNEVESCLASWLDIERDDISLKINKNRFGVRQTASKTVPVDRNQQVKNISRKINTEPIAASQNVLITGAATYLGHQSIRSLLEKNQDFSIRAYNQDKSNISDLYPDGDIQLFDHSDLESGKLSMGNVDVLVHIPSFDSESSAKQIANRLALASRLFTRAALHQVPAIVNISSLSVYGANLTAENGTMSIAPCTFYAQALYAMELMLESAHKINNQTHTTTLRLPRLAGEHQNLIPMEPAIDFINKTLQGEKLKPLDHLYTVESINIRDAAQAICALLNVPETCWQTMYDVGLKERFDFHKIAATVIGHLNGNLNNSDLPKEAGMNWYSEYSPFAVDTGWIPVHGMESTLNSLYNYFDSQNKALHQPSE